MQTRQTTRKSITLPGRYFTGLGTPEDVLLSDLSVGGCRFNMGERAIKMGVPIQIYVGSSGPHRAVVKWTKDEEVGVTFSTPLDDDLFESYQASHIPDPTDKDAFGEFDDMDGMRPQRFC